MSLYYVKDGLPVRWQGEPLLNVQLPLDVETLWSDAELGVYGLHRVSEASPQVPGKVVVNSRIVVENGRPVLKTDYADIVVSAQQVKDEARRRILLVAPEWQQANLTARGVELLVKGQQNWTPAEIAEVQAGSLVWARIKAIRQASNVIEAMNPIPLNYTDDTWWPQGGL